MFGGIGLRLLIGVLAFSSVVTLVLTALQLYLEFKRDVGTIHERLDEIGRSYLDTIGQSLWNLDEDQLRLQLNGILRLPDILAADVRDTSNTTSSIAIAVGESDAEGGVLREYPILHAIGGVERTIGLLRVHATLAGVYRSLLDRALIILVGQGAKTFIVSFFILYIFYRLVTRHLADVAEFLGGFSFKAPQQALALQRRPPKSPDELDQVVAAFNTLLNRLESAYSRLLEANLQLKHDNTALLLAEQALQNSERLFRDYAEIASDWFWETGPDHRFTYFSDQIGAFGVDRNRLIGTRRWDYAVDLEEEAEKWRLHREVLERREPFRAFTYSFQEKDGSLRFASSSGKPIFDDNGKFLGYRGTARDVTARSAAEARVRELSTAVEQSPAGIAIVDFAGRPVYSNRVFLDITDRIAAESRTAVLRVIPEEVWLRLSAAALNGGIGREEVFAARGTQGSFWGLVSVAGIKSADGHVERLVVALQDITREKAEQQEREALLLRLQQTGKMEAIGRLAGGIAHDFNNLLGSLMGFSQFLVDDLPVGTESRKYAERIVRITERGRDLVEQLLAYAGARDTERRVLDVVSVIAQGRDLLETSLPSSSKLVIDTGDVPLTVLSNQGQLHQIFLNLCLNAKDSLGDHPGTITITLSRTLPDQAACRRIQRYGTGQIEEDRAYCLVAVTDTGCGMDAETRARIFEPFFTTKGLGRGSGLGLAVVHGIVNSYGGAICVESEPGAGTRFEIYLPLADAMPELVSEVPHRECDARGHERILVVDDDADLAQALTIGLHRFGYEVVSVTSPTKALNVFREAPESWDLVVSDQVMLGMSGLELIAKLKELRADLPAILYTGFEEGVTEESAREGGIDVLLHKPASPQVLAEHIRRVFAAKAQRV